MQSQRLEEENKQEEIGSCQLDYILNLDTRAAYGL